jgi:UDP-N-acetylglucosamine transferase subunit ALG13
MKRFVAGGVATLMLNSALVISHAGNRPVYLLLRSSVVRIFELKGAGSILEALHMHTKLLVVVNTALMDNHQTELGGKTGVLGW